MAKKAITLDADMQEFYQQVADRMTQGEKQVEQVQVEGEPLPEWGVGPVLITADDVAKAIKLWDQTVPEEARGLLQAERAEGEEPRSPPGLESQGRKAERSEGEGEKGLVVAEEKNAELEAFQAGMDFQKTQSEESQKTIKGWADRLFPRKKAGETEAVITALGQFGERLERALSDQSRPIHVHLPETKEDTIINVPPPEFPVEWAGPPSVVVNVPEQTMPAVVVNLPEQAPPVVNIDAPITVEAAEPGQPPNVQVDVNVPVTPVEVTMEPPEMPISIEATLRTPDEAVETETFVERDPTTGLITQTTKKSRRRGDDGVPDEEGVLGDS